MSRVVHSCSNICFNNNIDVKIRTNIHTYIHTHHTNRHLSFWSSTCMSTKCSQPLGIVKSSVAARHMSGAASRCANVGKQMRFAECKLLLGDVLCRGM